VVAGAAETGAAMELAVEAAARGVTAAGEKGQMAEFVARNQEHTLHIEKGRGAQHGGMPHPEERALSQGLLSRLRTLSQQ